MKKLSRVAIASLVLVGGTVQAEYVFKQPIPGMTLASKPAPGAPVYAVLNTGDASPTLSVGPNGVWGGGSTDWGVVRANKAHSTGKYVYEAWVNSMYAIAAIGFATMDTPLTAQLGTTGVALGILARRGTYGSGIGYTATPSNYVTEATMLALDLDAGKGWVAQSGVWRTGNPETGESPTFTWAPGTELAPAFSVKGPNSSAAFANFGASPFVNKVPAGFEAGWF